MRQVAEGPWAGMPGSWVEAPIGFNISTCRLHELAAPGPDDCRRLRWRRFAGAHHPGLGQPRLAIGGRQSPPTICSTVMAALGIGMKIIGGSAPDLQPGLPQGFPGWFEDRAELVLPHRHRPLSGHYSRHRRAAFRQLDLDIVASGTPGSVSPTTGRPRGGLQRLPGQGQPVPLGSRAPFVVAGRARASVVALPAVRSWLKSRLRGWCR